MVRPFAVFQFLIEDHRRRIMDDESNSDAELRNIASQVIHVCQKAHVPHHLGIFYKNNPLEYSFSLILFETILVILLSRIVRFLLKPLKQPRIVSDIIGGIIIGPSVLGRNKSFTENVYPEQAQYMVANIGVLAFMFFVFLSGVKMDLGLISKTGKKHLYVALVGVFCPLITTAVLGFVLRPMLDKELAKLSGIGAMSSSLALTSFPVIYLILKELNLLSSEIGRMSLTTTMVSDALGIIAIIVFEALKQGEEGHGDSALWYVVSTFVIGAFFVVPIRRILCWIVQRTPKGKPVDQNYVIMILLGVLVMGFFTDMFGLAIANGSLWLGLVIPDGPPLGATIVERIETIVMEILMPFGFALVGLYTNVFVMAEYGWDKLAPVLIIFLVGYASKIVSVFVASLYFGIPIKDSLTLSLIMNLRGQLELVIFIHWMDKRIIGIQVFTMLVLLTIVTTSICAPLISVLYNPTKPYMVNKRRTIQHNPKGKELRIVVCIHEKENVVGLINLLEVSYPSSETPVSIYALRLIELVGRATPLLIDHDQNEGPSKDADHETIHNALKSYQEARKDSVQLHFCTAFTVKRTMYQDICKLALLNKASLIILPFEQGQLKILAGTEIVRSGTKSSISSNVIAHAPCSVGIFIDKGNENDTVRLQPFRREYKFVMLFLGGPDAREALIYADKMVINPDVSLTVVRFLSDNNEGDDVLEKKIDDGVVTWFWMKNESNERVVYREVVVKNGDETLSAIQSFNSIDNDLWIVGRKQGINPTILKGLTHWSENIELGVIGDYVSSFDFGSRASLLVVHQQIMRVQNIE
ncbi:cation/H(+) antiporter 24-like [Mercurialis annua]|uniref:cation/H(+) antiporter 24-like n=1 Tax=Mercurialis annua TaxID=3986 RepID=UPI00215F812C|nr:cation/H(+) antiporter 24-like [Mercurialis annua]